MDTENETKSSGGAHYKFFEINQEDVHGVKNYIEGMFSTMCSPRTGGGIAELFV